MAMRRIMGFDTAAFLLLMLVLHSALAGQEEMDAASPSQETNGQKLAVRLHRQRVAVQSEGASMTYKSVYFGSVFLGSPVRQEFTVVFDTGSGYLIVPSKACKSVTCEIHNRFDPLKSRTAIDVDHDGTVVKRGQARDQITLTFGTGEIVGQFVDDWVCLSDKKEVALEAINATTGSQDATAQVDVRGNTLIQKPPVMTKTSRIPDEDESTELHRPWSTPPSNDCMTMRVTVATDMSHEPFASFSFDGVLGLGLDALALLPELSFFAMMVSQKLVSEPTFGIFLAESDADFSEISFGGHNPERLSSNLTHVPVAMPELGYWEVKINAVSVGGKKLDFCNDGTCRAVVDTGTSLLAVPRLFAGTLQDELKGHINDPPDFDEEGSRGCKQAVGPEIQFELDGITIVLNPGDYTRQVHTYPEESVDENAEEEKGDNVMMQFAQDARGFKDMTYSLGFGQGGIGGRVAARETILMQNGQDVEEKEEEGEEEDDEERDEQENDKAKGNSKENSEEKDDNHAVEAIGQWQMDNHKCRPALMAIDFPEPLGPKLFIWGEPVLRKYYTEYNWEKKTVGFGIARHVVPTAADHIEFV